MSVKIKTNSLTALPTALVEGATTEGNEDRSMYFRTDGTLNWSGTQLSWSGNIMIDIVNSASGTVTTHTISTANSPQSLADGESMWVSIDRTQTSETLTVNRTSVTPIPAQTPTNRTVLVFARRKDGAAADLHLPWMRTSISSGQSFDFKTGTGSLATTTGAGTVQLNNAAASSPPKVPAIGTNGTLSVTATTATGSYAIKGTGDGSGAGLWGVGGAFGPGGKFTAGASGPAVEAWDGNISFEGTGGRVVDMDDPVEQQDATTKKWVEEDAFLGWALANWGSKTTGVEDTYDLCWTQVDTTEYTTSGGNAFWTVIGGSSDAPHAARSSDSGYWKNANSQIATAFAAVGASFPYPMGGVVSAVQSDGTTVLNGVEIGFNTNAGSADDNMRSWISLDNGYTWSINQNNNNSTGERYTGKQWAARGRVFAASCDDAITNTSPGLVSFQVDTPGALATEYPLSIAGGQLSHFVDNGTYAVIIGAANTTNNSSAATKADITNTGGSWASVALGTTSPCTGLIWEPVGERFIAIFASGEIRYSASGLGAPTAAWALATTIGSPNTNVANNCIATDGLGNVVVLGAGTIHYSTDNGLTYTQSYIEGLGGTPSLTYIAYGGGFWVAGGAALNGCSLLLTISTKDLTLSNNAGPTRSWIRRYPGADSANGITKIVYGNRQFAAITQGAVYMTPGHVITNWND